MDELRAELEALAAVVGGFMDDIVKLLDQAIATLDRIAPTCPWRREQIRSDHGRLTRYGRQCVETAGHEGPHRVPKAAKQANTGVWFNPDTGETLTQ